MRFLVAQHRAPGRRQVRERERIRHRAGRHQEHRDLALEQLGEALLDPLGPLVVAVAERIAGVGLAQRVEDFRRHSGGVVACEIHAFPQSRRARAAPGTMQLCCAAGSIRVPLVTCRERTGQQTVRRWWRKRQTPLPGWRHLGILGQHCCPNLPPRKPAGRQTASGPVRDRRAAKPPLTRRLGNCIAACCRERGRCGRGGPRGLERGRP